MGAAQTADPVIAKLNNSYALVLTGGRTAILKEGVSEEEPAEGSLISVEAFTQWHANRHLLDIACVQLREIIGKIGERIPATIRPQSREKLVGEVAAPI